MDASTAHAPAAAPVLQLSGIHKQFAGIPVLRDVQLNLYPGEIHALMGQNGAGKSTLIKVLTGVLEASGGQMRLGNEAVWPDSPLAAQRLGISGELCRAHLEALRRYRDRDAAAFTAKPLEPTATTGQCGAHDPL